MAPEVHYSDDVKTPSGQRSYGFKADIWSLAAVIVEMTLGQHQYFVDYSDGPPQFNWSRRIDYKNIRDMDLRDLIKSVCILYFTTTLLLLTFGTLDAAYSSYQATQCRGNQETSVFLRC